MLRKKTKRLRLGVTVKIQERKKEAQSFPSLVE